MYLAQGPLDVNEAARIAIIDDDAILVEGIGRLVRAMGYDVSTFTSAHALLSGDVARFDCVVSDVMMPDVGGVALLKMLRVDYPAIAVILITAFMDSPEITAARDAGAVCVLPKPFNDADLERCIELAIFEGRTS